MKEAIYLIIMESILSTSYKDINKNYSIDNNYLYLEELIQLLFVDM